MLRLKLLAALEAVADEGSFARAAARLHFTQSTLSQQIAALEREVGGALFDRPRGPKAATLTPLGKVVLVEARRLRQEAERSEDTIARFLSGGGRVEVATFQTVTSVLLPTVLRRLRDEQPDAEVRLFEGEVDEPRLEGIDLCFFDAPPTSGVTGALLLEDDYVVVAEPGVFPGQLVHRWALHNRPLVALPPVCDQQRVERLLAGDGVHPDMVFRTGDHRALLAVVRAGLGSALLPRLAVADLDGLVVHRLQPALPRRKIYLLWQGTLSPLAQKVKSLALEEAATLMAGISRGG